MAAPRQRRPLDRGRPWPRGDHDRAGPPAPGGAVGKRETGISLQTDDIDAYHEQLQRAGVDVDAQVSRMGGAGAGDVLAARPRRQPSYGRPVGAGGDSGATLAGGWSTIGSAWASAMPVAAMR